MEQRTQTKKTGCYAPHSAYPPGYSADRSGSSDYVSTDTLHLRPVLASRCGYKFALQELLIFVLCFNRIMGKSQSFFYPFSPPINSTFFRLLLSFSHVKVF